MDTHGHTRTATDVVCLLTDTHGRPVYVLCVLKIQPTWAKITRIVHRKGQHVLCVLKIQPTWAKITRTVHGKGQRADMCTDGQPQTSFKKLVFEPWDGSPGPPSMSTSRLLSSVGDMLMALTGRVVPPVLRTTAKAFAKDVFINQERQLGARRRSDTVLVSTINDADQGSADVAFRTPLAPYEKSKFLGSGGSMVARLKLKGIDGRAPPGVEPAA
ncbi:unnamed protein product [Brassica rapa]|uniref:Uncharacterized protein n=1 Tax=Brassica campestris TaxID=3711 RepID=A0A8D9D4B8_BRACM|nr:unnamed protein product [Brassica rapa]